MKHLALIPIALIVSAGACAPKPVVNTPPARCSTLIPSSWADGVPPYPIPDTSNPDPLEQIKAWAAAYVGADGQREKANGRTADTIEIVRRCEELVNAARPDQQ